MKQENKKQKHITEPYKDMPIVWRPIKELKPYKKNAKKHTKEQVKQIANSIQEFGFTQPVLIDKQNNVVAGHGRILGAKQAGYEQVPTLCLDDLTEEQIKAYRLADNKLNESEWDDVLLQEELDELDQEMMALFGFDFAKQVEEEEKQKYTRKINAPLYEPKGEEPDITELIDISKTKELLQEIENSSVTKKQKQFLKFAAYRHLCFDYGKIAEYYCHQNKEMQELMEESALVILDYDRAYELGYVNLMNGLLELNTEDEQNEL